MRFVHQYYGNDKIQLNMGGTDVQAAIESVAMLAGGCTGALASGSRHHPPLPPRNIDVFLVSDGLFPTDTGHAAFGLLGRVRSLRVSRTVWPTCLSSGRRMRARGSVRR